jgi:NADH:ubiquinone oxidoreductase subunit K
LRTRIGSPTQFANAVRQRGSLRRLLQFASPTPVFMEVALNWYLGLSAILFSIGTLGVLFKRNAIVLLMSVELMLNAVNLTLVALSQSMGDADGQLLVFFTIAVAAAEAAVGLAIVIAIFRRKLTVDITEINLFKF